MNKISSFLSGAILGALAGAAAVLLLTPASGDELQGQTRDWFNNLWHNAQTAAADKRSELEQQLASLKRQ
jgi:gas vesicle protein